MEDMTRGRVSGHLIRYAVPILLGNWFQLAYNAVDSIIAGRFIGRQALAAEGIASPVMNLVILAITGICLGAGVMMSEYFGAGRYPELKKVLANMLIAGFGLSLAVSFLGILFTDNLLRVMAVPEGIRGSAGVYLRITFAGCPFTFFYNALAAGVKSVGDSRTPLRFLVFAAILNAVLDLFFIGGLGFGIVCSAVTTVIAELASALMAAVYMKGRLPQLWPDRADWKIDRAVCRSMSAYAGVTALQQAVQPVGKLLIQGQVNALGVDTIAAFNAVSKVDDFACIPEQGIAHAITTFVAQNHGAGENRRAGRGYLQGALFAAAYWCLIGTLSRIFRKGIVSLFVTGEGADRVIGVGAEYLAMMAVFYLWPGMTNAVQGYFRGMGRMKVTLFFTCLQISVRTAVTFLLAPSMGIRGIALGSVWGWSLMLLFELPMAFHLMKREGRREWTGEN